MADLLRQALAYRGFARENPHLYDLMFGLSGHRPRSPEADGEDGWSAGAFGRLVTAAGRAITAGRLDPAEPEDIASQLWSALHGFVTLELAGHFTHAPGPLTDVLLPLTTSLLRGLGDDPDETSASIRAVLS